MGHRKLCSRVHETSNKYERDYIETFRFLSSPVILIRTFDERCNHCIDGANKVASHRDSEATNSNQIMVIELATSPHQRNNNNRVLHRPQF